MNLACNDINFHRPNRSKISSTVICTHRRKAKCMPSDIRWLCLAPHTFKKIIHLSMYVHIPNPSIRQPEEIEDVYRNKYRLYSEPDTQWAPTTMARPWRLLNFTQTHTQTGIRCTCPLPKGHDSDHFKMSNSFPFLSCAPNQPGTKAPTASVMDAFHGNWKLAWHSGPAEALSHQIRNQQCEKLQPCVHPLVLPILPPNPPNSSECSSCKINVKHKSINDRWAVRIATV